jgi:DNA-directed RNA polymerase subunit RPC12/RpoP
VIERLGATEITLGHLLRRAPRVRLTYHRWLLVAARRGPPMDNPEFVALELLVQCSSCGLSTPVTRPEPRTSCSNCLQETVVDDEAWKAGLTQIREAVARFGLGVMDGGRLERPGRAVEWRRGPARPKCEACGASMRASNDLTSAGCPSCRATRAIAPPPPFLRAMHDELVGVVVEEAAPRRDGSEAKPLALPCAKCGAAIVSDGSKRTVECTYCNLTNVIPDDVWHALHPPKLRRPISLLFALRPDNRLNTPLPWSEMIIDLLLLCIPLFVLGAAISGGLTSIFHDDASDQVVYFGLYLLGLMGIPLVFVALVLTIRTIRLLGVVRPEYEVVARFVDCEKGRAHVLLYSRDDFEHAIGEGVVRLTEERFNELGGVGGHIRAWRTPDGSKQEIRPLASGLV